MLWITVVAVVVVEEYLYGMLKTNMIKTKVLVWVTLKQIGF